MTDYITGATAYLSSKGLLLADPYTVEGLAELVRIQQLPAWVEPQAYYRVSGAQKVFCHLCGGHRHQLGMVGRCGDGTAILFGSECARHVFGEDIWKKLEAQQDLAITRANEEYRGVWIRENIGDTQTWLARNKPLLQSLILAWTELFFDHAEITKELLDHLDKNRGRIVEKADVQASRDALEAGISARRFSTTRIVLTLPAWEGISSIGNVDAHIAAIQLLCATVASANEPSVEDFARWDSFLTTKVRRGAANVDNFIRFSVALFADGVLEECGRWLDRQRSERLWNQEKITPRDAGKLLRAKVGHGYELPGQLLQETLPDFSLGRTIGKNATRLLVGG